MPAGFVTNMLNHAFGLSLRTDGVEAGIVYVSMVFNGLSGPALGLVPPLLSASWFPVHERTTATAISTIASAFWGSMSCVDFLKWNESIMIEYCT